MQADPIGEVIGLYAWPGAAVTEEFSGRMQSWWTQAAAEREPSSHADPVAFGIDFDEVRPRFARYVDTPTNGRLTDTQDARYFHADRPDRRYRSVPRVRVRATTGEPGDARLRELLDARRPGRIGLPRIGIEAVAANWDAHDLQINVAFPDGRVYRFREGRRCPQGGPTAGPPCWVRAAWPSAASSRSKPGRCPTTTRRSRLHLPTYRRDEGWPLGGHGFHVEATMAVPPWVQGAAARRCRTTQDVRGRRPDGGPRYEQLFTATGEFHVAGEQLEFTGSGSADPAYRRTQAHRLLGTLLAVGNLSLVAEPSATSPTRRVPTASPRSTRATSSPATAA